MNINGLFMFVTTALVFSAISSSQSTDVQVRRRDKYDKCVDNNDCYHYERCESKKCVNQCPNGVCGTNARCSLENHSPVCSCIYNDVGDPHIACVTRNCTDNNDCDDDQKCESNKCVDVCELDPCGDDRNCIGRYHEATCHSMCELFADLATNCSKRSCATDNDCYYYEKCDNSECTDVCGSSPCGDNSNCDVKDHSAVCTCEDKYFGDPKIGCVRQNCTSNNDCYDFEKCESDQCIRACESVSCGKNAWCQAKDHVGICDYEFGMTGNPLTKCVKKVCTTDNDCRKAKYCKSNKCTHVCKDVLCGGNAECNPENHTATCTCIHLHVGDPYTKCVRQNCTTSEDCYTYEKCESSQCTNVCDSSSCGKNARCSVENHIANCTCNPGFTGDPTTKCVDKTCSTNADCSDSEKCEKKRCINACEDFDCGFRLTCKVKDHTPVCACPDKYIGDAHTGCEKHCTAEADCHDFEICGNNTCINACQNVSCGVDALCRAKYHDAVCVCRPGLIGDPLTKCFKRNCTVNTDCFNFESCINETCMNACENSMCGTNAKCDARNHVAVCSCTWGLIGDPLTECLPRICNSSNDCDDDEHCERDKCTKACETLSCGANALCNVDNHTAICTCMANYTGNPYTDCVRPKCSVNEHCYKFEICESNECIPACESNSCGENAWCDIKNHIATCTCAPGLIGDPLTKCFVKGCNTSDDCSISEKCENKKCIVACEDVVCGPGMRCKTENHTSVCTCMDKYSGDINSGCVRNNCTADQDCYRSEICVENECVSACESISCGENTWCYVKDHVAVCMCLKESTGDPLTKCVGELEDSYWWTTSAQP